MARISNFEKKLKSQDPNDVSLLIMQTQCTMVNDYVDWEGLSGEVITRQLTKDEVKLYIEGKLTI